MFIERLDISGGTATTILTSRRERLYSVKYKTDPSKYFKSQDKLLLDIDKKRKYFQCTIGWEGKKLWLFLTNFDGNLFSADFAGVTLRCWMRREIALARESLLIAACCADPWWPNTPHKYTNTQVYNNTYMIHNNFYTEVHNTQDITNNQIVWLFAPDGRWSHTQHTHPLQIWQNWIFIWMNSNNKQI